MHSIIRTVIVATAVSFNLAGCLSGSQQKAEEPVQLPTNEKPAISAAPVGDIPSFEMTDANGNKVNLQDLKGKRIFMNLWATWCPPCVAEMPSIQDLYNKTSGNAAFVMLSFDEDFNKAKSFVARKQFSMPIYYAAGPLPNLLNVDGIPTTYIFDENGKLVFSHTGMSDYADEKFVAMLSGTR